MDVPKLPRFTWKTVVLPLIGLVAFFIYILLFNVDLPEIFATAARANLTIFFAAIVVSLVEVLFYALSWRSILSYLMVKISVVRSYLYVWYGTFLDIVIPAESISGELCRIYLVNREQSGSSGKVVASVVTQRLLGMGMNIIFLMVGINLLFNKPNLNPIVFTLILFFAVSMAVVMALILLVSAKETWSRRVITGLIQIGEIITRGKWKQLAQIKESALQDAKIFHDSMMGLIRRPTSLVGPTLLLAANWICSVSVPFLVFWSLGYPVPWSVVLVTSAIVVAVKSVPIGVPFEVGLPEITMTTLYTSMLGFQYAAISATATILSRILTLWMRFGIGFAAQEWVEIKMALTPKSSLAEKP